MRNIRYIVLFFIALLASERVFAADEVKLTASGPNTVILGRTFQISYTSNAKVSDFQAPAITDFDVLAGPFKSESHSTQIINGQVTSSTSVTYTFTLQAQREGTFTIPSASIQSKGQKYTSNGLSIKVLPEDEKSDASASSSAATSSAAASISEKNIFIKPILSKTNVFEQEAVKLTYKLYTTLDVVQFSNKSMPDFQGFLKQEFERTGNTQLAYENYDGRNYLTAPLYEVILYPQTVGDIIIEKAVFEAIVRVQTKKQVRSIFDDFFDSYTNVAKSVEVPRTKLRVRELPAGKPTGFYGLVGSFGITSSLSADQVRVNDALTLKVNITGNGNMRLLKTPDFKFPEDFEVYDPKVTNNFKTTDAGVSGNKVVEIIFIPRHSGIFEIPATSMPYFDLATQEYRTLSTPKFTVKVLKSDGSVDNTPIISNYANKEDVKELGKDIRFIYSGDIKLVRDEEYAIEQAKSWLLFILPLFLAISLYLLFRKHIQDNADLDMVKNRKANRMARKRLKYAAKLLKEGNKEQFYEEVMKAMWSYLSDKLIISMAIINKDLVTDTLSRDYNVDEDLINRLRNILDTCEFARFAPNSGQKEMGNLYEESIDVISELDERIKK